MPQAKSGPGLRRTVVGLLTLAALVPATGAYVNGGDFCTSQRDYEKRLKTAGWAVSCGAPTATPESGWREVAKGVRIFPADNAEYQRWVNQLVGRAVKALPEKEAARISAEDKRQLAQVARGAIHKAVAKKGQVIKEGQIGSCQYVVGAYEFETWWETRYSGKLEIHARQRGGIVPFVALKVVDPKDKARPYYPGEKVPHRSRHAPRDGAASRGA